MEYEYEDEKAPLLSPNLPTSPPPPAYSALPYRDDDDTYDFAPILNGRHGNIELISADGKRFLVHRTVLEAETVFFHIYYGFVPVWRLEGRDPLRGPPHPAFPDQPIQSSNNTTSGVLNNLICLPKFLTSLRTGTSPTPTLTLTHDLSQLPPPPRTQNQLSGPPVPPKPNRPVSAPTPTTSPYTWSVPETSPVLLSLLHVLYPRNTPTMTTTTTNNNNMPLTLSVEEALPTLEMTSQVIRAAMGYQASKAINLCRARLVDFINQGQGLDVYALASYFKFQDLAVLATTSSSTLSIPPSEWTGQLRTLMGKAGSTRLEELYSRRIEAMNDILTTPIQDDGHAMTCERRGRIEQVWNNRCKEVKQALKADSGLEELLIMDLRGGHCEECLVSLAKTVQTCLLRARQIPISL
ncbi:hypothetical protein BCR39DRAFT_240322 [Naematelia encephala]|uniref:BTB domain-containing protein n=1 Tax=Naematelia encephala TaxID=71784 RepID=A0A1Y2AXM3_9TREE|nr:hypothetical protein BCR39DRAFT_240322 [Naematelia encephala]